MAVGLLAAALLAAAPACSDDEEAVDPGLPKDEYVEQAVALCEAGRASAEEEIADLDTGTTEGQNAYVTTVATQVAETLAEVRELDAPAADAEDLDADLEVVERLARGWAADPTTVSSAVPADVAAASERLTDYGLGICVTANE